MSVLRRGEPAFHVVGFQSMTLNSTTGAVAVNSTCSASNVSVLDLSVHGGAVNYRLDSTAPTQADAGGVRIPVNSLMRMHGVASYVSSMKLIRATSTTAFVNLCAYRYVSEP